MAKTPTTHVGTSGGEAAIGALHLSVLQRSDSQIVSLLHHTKHVVIYHMVNNQWVVQVLSMFDLCSCCLI
jgi:hypothetical protein